MCHAWRVTNHMQFGNVFSSLHLLSSLVLPPSLTRSFIPTFLMNKVHLYSKGGHVICIMLQHTAVCLCKMSGEIMGRKKSRVSFAHKRLVENTVSISRQKDL